MADSLIDKFKTEVRAFIGRKHIEGWVTAAYGKLTDEFDSNTADVWEYVNKSGLRDDYEKMPKNGKDVLEPEYRYEAAKALSIVLESFDIEPSCGNLHEEAELDRVILEMSDLDYGEALDLQQSLQKSLMIFLTLDSLEREGVTKGKIKNANDLDIFLGGGNNTTVTTWAIRGLKELQAETPKTGLTKAKEIAYCYTAHNLQAMADAMVVLNLLEQTHNLNPSYHNDDQE